MTSGCGFRVVEIVKPRTDAKEDKLNSDLLSQVVSIDRQIFAQQEWSNFAIDLFAHKLFVALKPDKCVVLGYVVFRKNSVRGFITKLGVSPQHRRQGVGKALVGFVIRVLKDKRVPEVSLSVAVNNTSALQLYKLMGFVVLGTKPDFYGKDRNAYDMVFSSTN